MRFGTFIKLYNYDLKGYKSHINFDLYNRLSLLIPKIALPVRLYERRKGYEGHSHESTLSGLAVRLEEDYNENLEFSFSIDLPPINMQKIKGMGYAFKKGKIGSYSKKEGILFTVNGQSHGSIGKTFFDKDEVGLSYISDSLLIILNCSDISSFEIENLFMNSRDRLNKDAVLKVGIERELKLFLKNHKGLRELNNKRRREDTANKLSYNDKLEKSLQRIIFNSSVLAKILKKGPRLSNPFPQEISNDLNNSSLKDFPDYFKLDLEFSSRKPKQVPINNKRFLIQYETNAKNEYFSREKDPGQFMLTINNQPYKDFSINLWNGYANVNINCSSNWSTGTILKFESKATDIMRFAPFRDTFFVEVTKEQARVNNGQNGKRKRGRISGLDIPKSWPIKKNEWKNYEFETSRDILKIKGNSENGYDFYINIDNIHLLTEIKSRKTMQADLLRSHYMNGVVLFGLSFLSENKSEKKEKYSFEDIENLSKVLSPFLLPMIIDLNN